MRWFSTICLVLVAACGTGPEAAFNPHTGVASQSSAVVRLDRRFPARLDVRAVRFSGRGEEAFWLMTFVTRSDLNYPKIDSVFSFGRRLPYDRIDRRRVGLDRQEAGAVRLSRGVVEAAAATGLTIEMIGLRGRYGGHVPPSVFGEILGTAPRGRHRRHASPRAGGPR